MHAGERPKETAEVVALQNYLSKCKEKRIVVLRDEIKKAAERVVFLLFHATLDGIKYSAFSVFFCIVKKLGFHFDKISRTHFSQIMCNVLHFCFWPISIHNRIISL